MLELIDRIGRALVAPRRALAGADLGDGGAPDALILIAAKLVCGEARFLVAAVWALFRFGPGVAWSALAGRFQAAIGLDLLLILLGGVVVTLLAGRRRAVSRDFDLACVAWVPVLAVDTAASLLVLLFGWDLPESLVWVVALGWMAVLVALAVRQARAR